MGGLTVALAAGAVATGVLALKKHDEVTALDGETDDLFESGGYSDAAFVASIILASAMTQASDEHITGFRSTESMSPASSMTRSEKASRVRVNASILTGSAPRYPSRRGRALRAPTIPLTSSWRRGAIRRVMSR